MDQEFWKYHPFKGFTKAEFADSDFLRHKASGKIIDYSYLQRITDIEVFKELCNALEKESENLTNPKFDVLDW